MKFIDEREGWIKCGATAPAIATKLCDLRIILDRFNDCLWIVKMILDWILVVRIILCKIGDGIYLV